MFHQKCPLCPRENPIFTSRQKLVRHVAIRHRDSERDILFRCCRCRETYKSHSSLRTHIGRKHGEFPCQGDSPTSDSSDGGSSGDERTNDFNSVFQEAGSYSKLEEQLQFKAATLLIRIKEIHNATQKIVNSVISGVDAIYDSFLDVLQNRISMRSNDDVLSVDEILAVIEEMRGQSLFEGVNSTKKLDSFMDKEQGLIKPQKVVFMSKEVVKDNVKKTVDVDFGYIIPFLPSLEKILNCPEILECVDNPCPAQPGVFTSPLDSYFYQEHPVVKDDPNALAVGIYTDSVELTDTASSKSGVHAVTFIYFILFNLHGKLRSTIQAIFLLGCVKTSVLKLHGYAKVLEDFVSAMNKLSSKDGVIFQINGVDRVFHAVFVCCCGDNPASANIGGFKESHFASKPCRQCLVSREDMFKSFKESDFYSRTFHMHQEQSKELEKFLDDPTNYGKSDPSVAFGINHRSVLMDIENCDVTKCLPQDFMHDTIEGTLKLEICCLLNDVLTNKLMTLTDINKRIKLFSSCFGVNRPTQIDQKHLDKKKLRQTAAETLNLAFMLPFVLRKRRNGVMETVCREDNLKCYLLRLQLIDILMSDVLTLQDLHVIRQLTETHHVLFQSLYGCGIPKMHYEVHFATQILLYGPLRHHWCFRFEGKHAYFKRLMKILRSLKDPSGTFALRHQRKLCGEMLLSAKSDCGPFLQSSSSFGAAVFISLQTLFHVSGLLNVFSSIPNSAVLSQYKVVTVNGVAYGKRHALMVAVDDGAGMPRFGEIENVIRYDSKLAFVYRHMAVDGYESSLHAFKVKYCLNVHLGVILACELPYRHKLFYIKTMGASYIVAPERNFGPW